MILVEVPREVIKQLKAELVVKDEKITELHAWADSLLQKIEVLEALAAEQSFIIQQTQIDRDTWRSNYHGAEEKLAALAARHEKALIAGANMRLALADLVSWFPDKPTEPEWRLTAGVYGADEAIKAAQQILGDSEEKTDEQR